LICCTCDFITMWIQIRTMDGKKSIQIDKLSKLTTIKELKDKVAVEFGIASERQRLFFSGKQLENGHSLFDYNVGLNAIVQVMFKAEGVFASSNSKREDSANEMKPVHDPLAKCNGSSEDANNNGDENNNGDNGISSHFKVNDKVDAMDTTMGAWFEAIIVKVTRDDKGNGFVYHIRFEDYDENEILRLRECEVRPRARTKLAWDEIEIGDEVMANYNPDEPKERGFWYDVVVTRKVQKRTGNMLYGKIHLDKTKSISEECRIIFVDEIFKIERTGESDSVNGTEHLLEKRKVKPDCSYCKDDPDKICKECACNVCGGKHDPDKQIMCDECDMAYHIGCLKPPLEKIPEDDEWYCHKCRNDPSEIVGLGEKLKTSKKKQKMASASGNCQRDWGKGMACVGRTKVCTLVPSNHFGPIPGVPVGSTWKFRLQASEAGVHRPHVSGIHGRENEGAYSIVLAGGYGMIWTKEMSSITREVEEETYLEINELQNSHAIRSLLK